MKTEMVMPQMGESIAEATILKWLKGTGDKVDKDETILEISTDKVDSEIPAPASGVIVELKAKEGDTVAVKSVIAIIDSDASQAQTAAKAPPKQEARQEATKKAQPEPAKKLAPPPKPAPTPVAAEAQHASALPTHIGEEFYSPLVRNLAAQHGISPIELSQIRGTGTRGRVTKSDLMAYVQYRGAGEPQGSRRGRALLPENPRPEYGPDGTRIEVMDNMRKKIAEHMVRSKATSPHVYSTSEVDVSNIAKWRESKQQAFQSREGYKLSFTPFFLEAAIKALLQFPYVNASVDGDKLILKKNIHLGCAVALGTTGLIVPVIKNADLLSFVGIARALNDLATRARSKALTPDDVSGGTFTVTNPGVFGNIIGNPIINQPQVAILSIGAIKKRPVVVNDMIAIRDIVYLTLSYDHRIIDGSLGGQFLQFVMQYLESWDMNRESE